jgi:signal transduction histidine kinase
MGIIVTSINITDQKEKLEIEKRLQERIIKKQEKFKNLASQVVHDIRGPLASLQMLVACTTETPEEDRIILREIATHITDIANNLLSKYKTNDYSNKEDDEDSMKPLLVPQSLLQILTDKKYQYKNLPVKFEHYFDRKSTFAFINVQLTAFKRMISNIVNNSVDALEKKPGTISVNLSLNE